MSLVYAYPSRCQQQKSTRTSCRRLRRCSSFLGTFVLGLKHRPGAGRPIRVSPSLILPNSESQTRACCLNCYQFYPLASLHFKILSSLLPPGQYCLGCGVLHPGPSVLLPTFRVSHLAPLHLRRSFLRQW